MNYVVTLPKAIEDRLRIHLFQNGLEQGAFLFARPVETSRGLLMETVEAYLVPPEGWEVQEEVYLEMTDVERAKIMKLALDGGFAIIDCHSHPKSGEDVSFSPSDRRGITEFAGYAKWKLAGKPYTAIVWGEASLDAVAWYGDFREAQPVDEIHAIGDTLCIWTPRGTWFRQPRQYWSEKSDGD